MNIITHAKLPAGCSTYLSPPIFHCKASVLAHNSLSFHCPNSIFPQPHDVRIKARKQRSLGAIHASEAAESTTSTDVEQRWILQPVGDGDSRHLGFKVKMPDAFEIASSEVTVGRLPEKADMVIPVATVSAVHAIIRKKGESLSVIDLDSTNGTFIDEKRLKPGVVANVSSGSRITFGDTHLAMFLVTKLESVEAAVKPEESEDKVETNSSYESNEGTS